jgi:DNA adenine methylase
VTVAVLDATSAAPAPTRPVLRWHGGKWRLAAWIIAHFPPHRTYVEPYGGAGSILLRKQRSFAEVWNDLDDEVVTLFRVLRNPAQAEKLLTQLRLTPFARAEFAEAYKPAVEPIERCRRLIIRVFMGQGSVSNERLAGATGFRNNTLRNASRPFSPIPAHDWARYPEALRAAIERLEGVVIESRDAVELMRQHDRSDVLFYCDPPYLPETRSRCGNRKGGGFVTYAHELSVDDHRELLDFLSTLKGMVVLSGYPSPLYDEALRGWRRVDKKALADGARPRTECLWLNPAAAAACPQRVLL